MKISQMIINSNILIRNIFIETRYIFDFSLLLMCVFGCSSEKTITDEEYDIYTEVLKYIHEIDDLKYQKLSQIILNENTVIPDDITNYPEVNLSELNLTYLLEDCYVNLNNVDSIRKNLKAVLKVKYPLRPSEEIDSSTEKYIDFIKNKVNESIGNLETSSIIRDFIIKNTTNYKIEKTFLPEITNCEMISFKEMNSYFKNELIKSDWSDYFSKYPESTGILSFSRVGFNEQKTHAILYVEKICGYLCGTGSYLFYYKISDSWKVGSIFRVWTK
jgi:hypothetical protein